jgi:hypothetical protein
MGNLKFAIVSILLIAVSNQVSALQTSEETGTVNVLADGQLGNRLQTCHVVGTITEWEHSDRALLDVTGDKLGEVDAGLAQFGADAWLEGCGLTQYRAPADNTIDLSAEVTPPQTNEFGFSGGILLSGVLANYLIADGHKMNDGNFDKQEAGRSAAQLLRTYYSLAETDGYPLPLVKGVKTGALGSSSFQFNILLIKNLDGTFDAVVRRRTMGTKFAPVLSDADSEATGIRWSSIR